MKTLPIDVETKTWIDSRIGWIIQQFGLEHIRACPIVAADSKLLDGYNANDEAAFLELCRKICVLMGIDFETIEFLLMENQQDHSGGSVLGIYELIGDNRHLIRINVVLLPDPNRLIPTLVHELCHVFLIGQGRITGDEDDHELLTDLLTVFFGFGALCANSVIDDQSWHVGSVSGWQISRSGYLTMNMYGYALGVFALLRNERYDDWKPRLRLDVRDAFKQTFQYYRTNALPNFATLPHLTAWPTGPFYNDAETPKLPPHDMAVITKKWFRFLEDDDVEIYKDPVDYASPEADSQSELESEDFTSCTYCGQKALYAEPTPMCVDCHKSLQENEVELQEDRIESEKDTRLALWLFFGGIFGLLVSLLLISLLT
jgi:hypothetical protein